MSENDENNQYKKFMRGETVTILSTHFTFSSYGGGQAMKDMVGKNFMVQNNQKIGQSPVVLGGLYWDSRDLVSIKDASYRSRFMKSDIKSVEFNPEELVY